MAWGWDPTPGIVSVWAEADGRAVVWRRDRRRPARSCARTRASGRGCCSIASTICGTSARGWRRMDRRRGDAGASRGASSPAPARCAISCAADDGRALAAAVLHGASRRLGRPFDAPARAGQGSACSRCRPRSSTSSRPGRTYFRDLPFDQLHRLQFDLETTGLDAAARSDLPDRGARSGRRDRAARGARRRRRGRGRSDPPARRDASRAADPDVIENHNLHGFDLPFLDRRARRLGVPLALGRIGAPGLRQRAARRGVRARATTRVAACASSRRAAS